MYFAFILLIFVPLSIVDKIYYPAHPALHLSCLSGLKNRLYIQCLLSFSNVAVRPSVEAVLGGVESRLQISGEGASNILEYGL